MLYNLKIFFGLLVQNKSAIFYFPWSSFVHSLRIIRTWLDWNPYYNYDCELCYCKSNYVTLILPLSFHPLFIDTLWLLKDLQIIACTYTFAYELWWYKWIMTIMNFMYPIIAHETRNFVISHVISALLNCIESPFIYPQPVLLYNGGRIIC